MKKRSLKIGLMGMAAIAMLSFTQATQSDSFKVLTDKSEVKWTARKVGGEHTGTVGIKSGSFTVQDSIITKGEFVMDMTTINVTDTESKKLHKHLRSKDFFNVETYTESKLVITGSKKVEGNLVVTGNLTILDKTNPITFNATSIGKTENFQIYSATITVDRTKYGIVYKSSAVGDTFIKDNFDIKVKLTGEKEVN